MNMNATLIAQLIAFLIFVWFCSKFVWPPLIGAIEKRQKEIADSLSAAEIARQESLNAKSDVSELISKAKEDAKLIIEQANKNSAAIIEQAKKEALIEKQKIVDKGVSEIELEKGKTKENLRKELAKLVAIGAEKVIEESIDPTMNEKIVDRLITEL